MKYLNQMSVSKNKAHILNIGCNPFQVNINNKRNLMSKGGHDEYFDFLNELGMDDYNKKMLIDQIQEMGNREENQPPAKRGRHRVDAKEKVIENLRENPYGEAFGNNRILDEEEDLDLADQLEQPGKRFRQFEVYQPPKYKILGHNQEGKPIFKMSDVFLTDDPKVRDIIDKEFNDIIYSKKQIPPQVGETSKDKMTDLQKIIQKWEKNEYEDFTTNRKNQLTEEELEQIVVNRGDQKRKYFIYKVGERNNMTIEDINKSMKSNPYLESPKFSQNLFRYVNKKRMELKQIQEFESSDEEEQALQQKAAEQHHEEIRYWGQCKGYDPDKKKKRRMNRFMLKESVKNEKLNEQKSLVEQILQQYRYYNKEVVNESYKKPREQFNRIEFHLEDPNFFMTKLHTALKRKSQLLSGNAEFGKNDKNPEAKNMKNSLLNFGQERSRISGSLLTGNRQLSVGRSNFDGAIEEGNEDHETIEQRIQKQMNHYSRKPISHSEVATQLIYLKFSTNHHDFSHYHRHEFKFESYTKEKVRVSLLRHTKPIKNKGTDLNINIQKTDSYKKFSKPESLSLASEEQKQFIVIEYIEETPLLMSDVGMCERMILQVNYNQMLQRINKDLMDMIDFEDYEMERDNAKNTIKNTSTQKKMEIWRENVKKLFGENGKVFLWQPRREGKLIGNPEGQGVALMESNLGCVPVVKKTPNKRDFLLVREGKKWVLRKIDSMYVGGQVQPKRIVFTPDNRSYNSFLQKYQMDFIKKIVLDNPAKKLYIDTVKNSFPSTLTTAPENRLRKILKKMKATTRDNKGYTIPLDEGPASFLLQPEDACLYWRMQKSISQLQQVGIKSMKSMDKMKSILRKFFRTDPHNLDNYVIARMIKGQLQLTSWYLTESFNKFIEKKARIQMRGHADPTKGKGGYSFIKKPQKERTDRQQVQEKQQKIRLSGTQYDLRKLKAEDSQNILRSKGYSQDELKGKHRWDLVDMVKKEKNTQFSRKERETREQKEENEKKQRSKLFNELLKLLKGDILPDGYDYSYKRFLTLEDYREAEKHNWENALEVYEKRLRQNENMDNDDDGDDDDS